MTNHSAKGKKLSTGGEISWKNDAARKTTDRKEIREETPRRTPSRAEPVSKKQASGKR